MKGPRVTQTQRSDPSIMPVRKRRFRPVTPSLLPDLSAETMVKAIYDQVTLPDPPVRDDEAGRPVAGGK